ncbi:MAG: outer membrane beta-barrel protein [Bacteroidia bacterium]|jgi:hypothetical protein
MKFKIICLKILLLLNAVLWAQQKPLEVESYQEVYGSSNFTRQKELPPFFYNHKILNRPSVNIILIQARYHYHYTIFNIGLMGGDYTQYNLAHEPEWAKPIYTMYATRHLNLKTRIEAGVFASHLGLESVISSESPTLSRSLIAENSPYYESGIRVLHKASHYDYGCYILNGWQRISWNPLYKLPALGAHFQYQFPSGLHIQYSSFFGSSKPDSLKRLRFYNHFNSGYTMGAYEWYASYDIGFESGAFWMSPQWLGIFHYSQNANIACRFEWFYDPKNIQITSEHPLPFNTFGWAICHTIEPQKGLMIRFEPKYYWSKNGFFNVSSQRFYLSAGVSYRLKIY